MLPLSEQCRGVVALISTPCYPVQSCKVALTTTVAVARETIGALLLWRGRRFCARRTPVCVSYMRQTMVGNSSGLSCRCAYIAISRKRGARHCQPSLAGWSRCQRSSVYADDTCTSKARFRSTPCSTMDTWLLVLLVPDAHKKKTCRYSPVTVRTSANAYFRTFVLVSRLWLCGDISMSAGDEPAVRCCAIRWLHRKLLL